MRKDHYLPTYLLPSEKSFSQINDIFARMNKHRTTPLTDGLFVLSTYSGLKDRDLLVGPSLASLRVQNINRFKPHNDFLDVW